MKAIEKLFAEFWPGVPVIPTMSSGATNSTYLRNVGIPAYGHSGLADDVDDFRAHGKDRRIAREVLPPGHEYLYRLVKMLSGEDQVRSALPIMSGFVSPANVRFGSESDVGEPCPVGLLCP